MIVLYCDGGPVQFNALPEKGTKLSSIVDQWPDASYLMTVGSGVNKYAVAFKHWATLVAFRIQNGNVVMQWIRLEGT